MAQIRPPLPVKLILGILTSRMDVVSEMEDRLAADFGAVDAKSELFPFNWTGYYEKTMGSPLVRLFLGFRTLIDPYTLAEVKVRTNAIEAEYAARPDGAVQRPINLDPGYMEQSKIVLASTKNFFHRILLSQGIYGEVTLHFQDGIWKSFPWTFPDYKSDCYHPFFSALREHYRLQLQQAGFQIRIPRKPHLKTP